MESMKPKPRARAEFVVEGPVKRGRKGFKAYDEKDLRATFRRAVKDASITCPSSRLQLKLFLFKFAGPSIVSWLESVLRTNEPLIQSIHILLVECILKRKCVDKFMNLLEKQDRVHCIRRITLQCMKSESYGLLLRRMQTNRTITQIDICGTNIDGPEAECVEHLLLCNPRIQHLHVNNCNITATCLQRICQAAKHASALQSLALSGNRVTPDLFYFPGVEQTPLQKSKNLSLNMEECANWGRTLTAATEDSIGHNTTLRSLLTVSEDLLQDLGPASLTASLANNNHGLLRELQVRGGRKRDFTAQALVQIVSNNTCLRKLSLDLYFDDHHDMVEILDALCGNASLREIFLHPTADETVLALAQVLVSNQTLETITVGWSFVGAMVKDFVRQRFLTSLCVNRSVTHFSVACFEREWPGCSEARFCTDRNRMDQFLALRTEERTPRLWLYGLERASSASLSALFHYVRETSDILKYLSREEDEEEIFM